MRCRAFYILTPEDNVRHKLSIFIFVVIIAAASTAGAQQASTGSADPFLGTWTGTWDGGGASGPYELTLERQNDGSTVARVTVTGDPAYMAMLPQVSFDGSKMTATYDFPPQPETEVVLVTSFDGNAATGTWSLREKATGFEVVNGHVNVTRN